MKTIKFFTLFAAAAIFFACTQTPPPGPVTGPVVYEGDRVTAVKGDYWGDQQLFAAGVDVDDTMRPVDAAGRVVWDNLRAAGSLLAGAIRWTEKSGDGIAVASALRAADAITGPTTAHPSAEGTL